MRLSKHFIQRWEERVQQPIPTPADIKRMLKHAIWLQKDNVFFSGKNRYKTPALYWVPDKNIVLKIDEKSKTVMTVITRDMYGRKP